MDNERLISTVGEVVSISKSNDIFVEVTFRVLTDQPNKNNEAVTEAFIDDMVEHSQEFGGLPLYVDIKRLKGRCYTSLTHLLNRVTGKYNTTMIGTVHNFKKQVENNVVSLIATARIPKRDQELCDRIIELFELGLLCFSFEIQYIEPDTYFENGVMYIDVGDRNMLCGVCVVSHPADVDAVALDLVAEDLSFEMKQPEPSVEKVEGVEEQEMDEKQAVAAEVHTDDIVAESVETVAEAVTEQVNAEIQEEPKEDKPEEKPEEKEDPKAEQTEAEEIIAHAEAPANVETPVETAAEVADIVPAGDVAVASFMPLSAVIESEVPITDRTVEDAEICAQHAAIEADIAGYRAQIAKLEAEIEALRAEHDELEAYRAAAVAAELAERQGMAKAFAEEQGLNLAETEVSNAIAEVDYEKLAKLSMSSKKEQKKAPVFAAFNGGDSFNVNGRFE